MNRMLIGFLISIFITLSTQASETSSDINYSQIINDYYSLNKELLLSQDVVDAAQSVVHLRDQFSSSIIAKAFSLLSDVAYNRGNLLVAFQLAQYGSEIDKIDIELQLDLMLKVARGYYAQGNYLQLQDTSQGAAWLAEQANNMNYHLQALAYSVVAYALNAEYEQAVKTLNKVETLLTQNLTNVDQITLLEIIAQAHFYLSEYDSAVEILTHVIKLRTDLARSEGIARSYHLVAKAYYQLHQYDDAYNAFWQSLEFSKQYKLDIHAAYAELGLGQVLLEQQQLKVAKKHLLNAQVVFNQYNLVRVKLSTKISLVKVMFALGEKKEAENVLLSAQALTENIVLTPQQIELYLLLTDYYITKKNYALALKNQSLYLSLYRGLYPNVSVKNSFARAAISTSDKAKNLALNLAEKSQLSLEFNEKYSQQKTFIIILSALLCCSIIFIAFCRFQVHRQQLNRSYDEIELPQNQLAQPVQTKRWYQQQYKIARKYQYEASITYLKIENWQELNFRFNRKILNDVSQALAIIINENIDEEDYAGVISAGEYLFLCPHQSPEQALIKFTRIKQAINTRFFANLGDYSVKVIFSIDSPNIQDIDPYVFLSRLSEFSSKE